ncbi:MAG: hypothetical protein IRZ02_07430 [Acidothermus sp.]|nr:hypothetical protein [Acidothermus sp.]
MLAVLGWLAIPVAALIVGLVSAARMSRPRRPAGVEESVESFSRFRRALASGPVPNRIRSRRRRLLSVGRS